MAATFRQIVNNVLQNIGSPQIPATQTVVTDTYQLQVCNFVNHIKEEVEAETDWACLWTLFTMEYFFPNTTQQIIDMNNPNQIATSESRVARMYNHRFGREVPLCFNITTFGIPFLIGEMPLADLIYYNTVLNQTPVAYSTNFATQDLGNDDMELLMYPAANTNFIIAITMVVPQPRIDPTIAGSDAQPWLGNLTVGLDSPVLVPRYPIELGASWYALSERGEELGTNSMFTEERYRVALDNYASQDLARRGGIEMLIA